VKRNRGSAAVGMTELFVRTTLPDLGKAMPVKQVDNLASFKDGNRAHLSGDLDLPYADEL
jgi:hypothetical protein